jgi:hypothetical protein
LGKSIEEVMNFSVLELSTWSAYYKWEYDLEKKRSDSMSTKRRR